MDSNPQSFVSVMLKMPKTGVLFRIACLEAPSDGVLFGIVLSVVPSACIINKINYNNCQQVNDFFIVPGAGHCVLQSLVASHPVIRQCFADDTKRWCFLLQ